MQKSLFESIAMHQFRSIQAINTNWIFYIDPSLRFHRLRKKQEEEEEEEEQQQQQQRQTTKAKTTTTIIAINQRQPSINTKRKDDLNEVKMTEMFSNMICGTKQDICDHNGNTACQTCRNSSLQGATLSDEEEGFSELEEDGEEETDHNEKEKAQQQQIHCELQQSHVNEQLSESKRTQSILHAIAATACEPDTHLLPIVNNSNDNDSDEIEGATDENDDDETNSTNIKRNHFCTKHEKYEKYRNRIHIIYNDENIDDECNNKEDQLLGQLSKYSKESRSPAHSKKDQIETFGSIHHHTENLNAAKQLDMLVQGNTISPKPTLTQISSGQLQLPPLSRYIQQQQQQNLPPDLTQTYTLCNNQDQRQNNQQQHEHEESNTSSNRIGNEMSSFINTNFSSLLDAVGGSNYGGNANFGGRLSDDKFSVMHNAAVNTHEFLTKKYYHPLFAHGVCRWPGCELDLEDINGFL
uniref:Uncharacterized protein n=1 Tax=Glossina brevipalpis TaxID=37001 RepID=A0A1A9WYF0_9MUSC